MFWQAWMQASPEQPITVKRTMLTLEKKKRTFLAEDLKFDSWEAIKRYYEDLANREINSLGDLKKWLKDRSELEAALSEDFGWRYIRMTCDTANEQYSNDYTFFVSEIQPKTAPYTHALNNKFAACPFAEQLTEDGYFNLKRSIKKDIEIFREENIPLFTEIQHLGKDYSTICGDQTVEIDGQELTMQQAGLLLLSPDRSRREMAWKKIVTRRAQDREKLDELFNKMVKIRHQIATNAGFKNFRDYMFTALGRFDYRPEDCFAFHNSIKTEIVPLLNKLARERKKAMKLEALRPWDKSVDPQGREALKPFSSTEELLEKSIKSFAATDPFLGSCITVLKEMEHLDLGSRKGKAPGGYNYPLPETGVPFIFMNATSNLRDLVTFMHEGGHAVHSIVTRDLELTDFKETPSEVAELASMSMELISMNQWNLFFEGDDWKRAQKEHLEQVIETLPWIAIVDKFQHWIYENPNHTVAERENAWIEIYDEFTDGLTDWDGFDEVKKSLWHKQLHIFEVPFYYVEYGFAQLGAIAVWKNYRENPAQGIQQYLQALRLGYTKTIPEIYEAAGVKFDFSQKYIQSLIGFLYREYEKTRQ